MVIPTAAAFGVEMDNLSTAYAILTANGVQTAQSTTYLKSMMSELANTGSEVSKTLMEETGQSFSQLMENGYSLGDVMQILGDSVDGNTTAFMNLWGSMEAGSGAVSLYNSGAEKYASVLDQMQRSAGATSTAYGIMTDTTEFASQRMENSLNNLSIAFGDDLNPVIRNTQHGIADVADSFTDLLKKNPAVSASIAGLTTGFGLVTAGVAAYTAAVNLGNVAMAAFGVTSLAALWPLAAIAAAIAAVSAGVIYYNQQMEDAAEVSDNLVISSQHIRDELDGLQEQYQNVANAQGRDNEEAYALQHRIDELSESFDENRRTIGEVVSEAERLSSSLEQTHQTYDDLIATNGQLEYSSMALVQQLVTLSDKSTHTDAELLVMQGIVDSLNGSYEGLNLTLDQTNGKLSLSVEDLYSTVTSVAEEANKKAAMEALVGTIQEFDATRKLAEEALTDYNDAYIDYSEKEEAWRKAHPIQSEFAVNASSWSKELKEAESQASSLQKAYVNANNAYKDSVTDIEEYCEVLGYSTEQTQDFIKSLEESGAATYQFSAETENLISGTEAAGTAFSSVQGDLEDLATKYDEAYNAAYSSIDGQIGLFEKMKTESELTVGDMQSAMESQIEYIGRYTENLQKAQEYGLDDSLISKLSDGSAESAGQLDAIINKIEKLGGSSEEAQNFVTDFNSSFEQVTEAKDTFAETVAEMETDFAKGMDDIKKDLDEALVNMDMSDEAAEAAANMMDAYINTIKSKTSEVNSALGALSFTNNAVIGSGIKVDGAYKNAYAEGTLSAEPGLALVGEDGPELVNFGGGEVVYTADETADILSSAAGNRNNGDFYVSPMPESEGEKSAGKDEKVITLKLEGSGDLTVKGGADEESVVNWLLTNLKGALMDVVRTEITEEGEGSYEF